jgi:hypothetical protein
MVRVRNRGDVAVSECYRTQKKSVPISLQVWDGDPGEEGVQIGGNIEIEDILAHSYIDISVNWETAGLAGSHQIYVIVDVEDVVEEGDEENNIASTVIDISEEIDLMVEGEEITYSPEVVIDGQEVVFVAIVHNQGALPASNVEVAIYDGRKEGGIKVGEGVIGEVLANGSNEVEISFLPLEGVHQYWVYVDPGDKIKEMVENNNMAFREVEVLQKPDLVFQEITYEPSSVVEGEEVVLRVCFANEGGARANEVVVRFYDGDPERGGMQIGNDQWLEFLEGGISAIAEVGWDTSGQLGNNEIYVLLDVNGKINSLIKRAKKEFDFLWVFKV